MLNEVAKYHDEWIRYVGKICTDTHYIEDIVQEMYLKVDTKNLYQKIIINGKVNKWYICTILKNLIVDYYRAKSKVTKVDYIEVFEEDFKTQGVCKEELEEIHQRHLEICETLRNEHTYYERFYLMYTCADNPSLQDIADISGLSKPTCYNDLKKIKKILTNGKTS